MQTVSIKKQAVFTHKPDIKTGSLPFPAFVLVFIPSQNHGNLEKNHDNIWWCYLKFISKSGFFIHQ